MLNRLCTSPFVDTLVKLHRACILKWFLHNCKDKHRRRHPFRQSNLAATRLAARIHPVVIPLSTAAVSSQSTPLARLSPAVLVKVCAPFALGVRTLQGFIYESQQTKGTPN